MADDIQPEVADDTADDIDETTQGDQAPSAGDDLPESGDTDAAATDEPVDPTADDSKADDDAGTDDESNAADTDDDTGSPAELVAQLAELRAEYEVLQRQQEESEKPRRLHRPSRHWVSIACVVLGGLLLPLAVLVRWTSNTVLDTDSYVETVAPLAQNEDIQEALSFRVSVILLDAIDFQMLAEEALPPRAGFLAAPIESGVRVLVQDVVDGLVSTQAFERLWEDVNRVGHENVVAVLTGEGNDTLDTADGKVVVRLGPIAGEVLDRLDDILGTDLKNSIPDERLDGEFVLVESDELASLQDEISLFDRLSWLIPILTIALLAASVVISRPRRLAFRRLGIAVVAPMTISLLLYDWVRSQYVGALPDDVHNPDAAAAFFDITTRFVPRDMRVLLVVGVVILFLTWLFGPTGWAGRARVWWDTLVGRVGDKSEGRDVGVAPRWVADNKRTLLAFAVALGVLTLLVWTRPTGLVVLTVIVVVVLLMAVTSLVAEIGRRAERADTGGGTDAADASDAEPSIDAESAADAESSVSN
jgi:hypothetical protein